MANDKYLTPDESLEPDTAVRSVVGTLRNRGLPELVQRSSRLEKLFVSDRRVGCLGAKSLVFVACKGSRVIFFQRDGIRRSNLRHVG